jgi:diguanylate cyclase (GGDEF)-like protein/PAS domain S-box-containing protein
MKKEKTTVNKLEMFDALMENIPDSIYFKDLKSRFIGISKALIERLKINNTDEALGKTDFDYFSKEHADKAFCDEQTIINTNVPLIKIEEKETYEGRKDRWVSTTKMPLYGKKGKIIGTFGISRDITEHKQAEKEIKSLAKFPEENPNLVGRADYDGKLLYCNHTYIKIFKDDDNIPIKLQDTVKKIAAKKTFNQEDVEIEIGDRIFLFNLIPIKEENYINFYGVDITERKEAEETLLVKERAIQSSLNAIAIADLGGNLTYVNPSFLKLWGYDSEKDVLGKSIPEFCSEKEDANEIIVALQNSGSWIGELLAKKKDGSTFFAQLSANLVTSPDGKPICMQASFIDTTERKKAETEILYLSYHDQLTGLYNRRFFEEELKRLDTKRQLPASIIMADVDGLKYVNDSYGHETGDRLLIAASEIIKNSCRKEDIITRWGGDEFIIFLPKTSEKDARDVIDRIRKASKIQKSDDKINISISLGLTTKNDSNESIEHIIKQADKNMYIDKAAKKSQIILLQP